MKGHGEIWKQLDTNLEATRQEFETQLAVMDARTRHGGSVDAVSITGRVKPSKFDGSVFWAIFHRQFEGVAFHNSWTSREATHLLAVFQGQAADF